VAEKTANVILTRASDIPIRPVKWLWRSRMPVGSLVLLAGREGVGKSTLDCWIAAQVTRGSLPGELHGAPANVIYIATEDDWNTTLVPRLMAAGADLDRVYKVAVKLDGQERESQVYLPENLNAFEAALEEVGPALVVLSPLMSRVSGKLDAHKDQQVRQALEPLVEMAERHGACFLGLIHLNKSVTADPLRAVMASAAFVAVARAVLFVARDPEDPETRVVGQPKNNLGQTDFEIGLLTFTIENSKVGQSAEGEDVFATRLRWGNDRDGTIEQVLTDTAEPNEARTATREAADWLLDYLAAHDGEAPFADVQTDSKTAGISIDALKRGRVRARVESVRTKTVPSTTVWRLPGPKLGHSARSPLFDLSALSAPSTRSTQRTEGTRDARADLRRVEPPTPGQRPERPAERVIR